MRKKIAETIFVKTNFRYKTIEIVLGFSFHYVPNKNSFFLSTTPYSDPTLAPISNIVLDQNSMRFDAIVKSKIHSCCVDYGGFRESPIIAELIESTNEGRGVNLGLSSNNDIEYQSEENEMSIRLSNSRRQVVHYFAPPGRIICIEDDTAVPPKVINCLDGSVQLRDFNLDFSGKKVDDGANFRFSWQLEFSSSIIEPICDLLQCLNS